MKAWVLAASLAVVPSSDPAVEKACPKGICTLPAEKLQWLLDAHNNHIDEIRGLREELRRRDHDCETRRRIES